MLDVKDMDVDGKILSIPGIRDRAYISIGYNYIGVLDRNGQTGLKISLKNNTALFLYVIVENMGRVSYGNDMRDPKV